MTEQSTVIFLPNKDDMVDVRQGVVVGMTECGNYYLIRDEYTDCEFMVHADYVIHEPVFEDTSAIKYEIASWLFFIGAISALGFGVAMVANGNWWGFLCLPLLCSGLVLSAGCERAANFDG